MDNNNNRILQLLEKYSNGTASADELEELDLWYHTFDQEEKLTDILAAGELKNVEQRLLTNIDRQLGRANSGRPVASGGITRRKWLSLTAFLLVFFFVGLFIINRTDLFDKKEIAKIDVLPGGNKAILILGNGKRIDLSSSGTGTLAHVAGISIIKSNKSTLTYTADEAGSNTGNTAEKMTNTVITPKGGQFEVQLPDGTRVWLNAASSLTYPVHFSGGRRAVWLTGEGYFEVAKDKTRPFDVSTGNQHVQVLGTHFNVNAYPDEDVQKTTLLEGSVKVVSKTNAIVIKPGEQAVNNGSNLHIRRLNAEDAVAWKNGLFHFDHTELHELMRELSRWYDVEIVYEGQSRNRLFSGTIDKTYSLSEVLKVLELGKVDFRIELSPPGPSRHKRLVITP
jgi:hypothetical protein